jgi:hypothetical protein
MVGSEQAASCHRYGLAVADHQMVQYAHPDQPKRLP